jgi:GDP-L-fucose synthase
MSRLLLTGSKGLCGSAIVALLADEKNKSYLPSSETSLHCTTSADTDLCNHVSTDALFQRVRPSHVIHCAARVGGLFKNQREPVEMGRLNLQMQDNVFENCKLHNSRLIIFLSTCIFPDKTTYPIDETMLHNGPPHPSNAAYAYSKRMAETMSQAYRSEYCLDSICVIPTNLYGPNDNFELEDAHVIPALIHKAILAKRAGKKLVVAGTGAPLRQFLFSSDLAKVILLLLKHYDSSLGPIIISPSSETEVSIGDVARLIARFTGLGEENIVFDSTKSDGQFRKTADNRKLKTFLDKYAPSFVFTPLEVGIKESCEWMQNNFDSCRK